MGRNTKHIPPFETEIIGITDRGLGIGTAPDDRPVHVRFSPPGARVRVVPQGRSKGVWSARRVEMIRPPPQAEHPSCPRFQLCGGCSLSELNLDAQRAHKHASAIAAIGPAPTVHPPRGSAQAYGYRNKLELSFGVARYLSEQDLQAGLPRDGRYLGLHAAGRFDRVVDIDDADGGCLLGTEAMRRIVGIVRTHTLSEDAPLPFNPRSHEGGWRHLVLREGHATGELLAIIHTTSAVPESQLDTLANALLAADYAPSRLVGVAWRVHDGVSDVATGPLVRVWGERPWLHERLMGRTFQIGPDTFFQTNTEAAEALYATIGEALGEGGTLLDLYCGCGSIGISLADRFDHVVGVEIVAEAVEHAEQNARINHTPGRWVCGAVEDALDILDTVTGRRQIVVDPPRAGLHPRAAEALANADADSLVYVACRPASLGRDRAILEAGGWRMTDLWTVDLFPQTGHMEAVARFVREPPTA